MLSKNNFSKEHIDELRTKYKRDPALLERTIYAFGMLEAISQVQLPFIFKGGTCLMLLLNNPADFDLVKKTYTNTLKTEIAYRGETLTEKDCLIDTIKTAQSISSHGKLEGDEYINLQEGARGLGSFIFSESFNPEVAAKRAPIVMYFAACLLKGLIESTEEERENYSVRTGDIFFTRTSETIEEVGFTSVCLKTIENATFAGFVIRVRPNTDDLIPDFSKYYFKSEAHRRFFVKEMNLVTRASLSQDLLKRLPVLIPPKEEQKAIAEYLDKTCATIDSAIEQKQKLIEKLTEYKKSLIYECVTGKREI